MLFGVKKQVVLRYKDYNYIVTAKKKLFNHYKYKFKIIRVLNPAISGYYNNEKEVIYTGEIEAWQLLELYNYANEIINEYRKCRIGNK